MNNIEKYNKVFKETFDIKDDKLNEELKLNVFPEWDSMGHISLISALEDEFDIMFDSEDILEIQSYDIGKEILRKYNIKV